MTVRAADQSWYREPDAGPESLLARMGRDELRAHIVALQSVTAAALSHLTLPDLLRELLDRLRTALDADTATVLLTTGEDGTLAVRASAGLEGEVERGVEIPIGRGIAGAVAENGRAVIVDDVSRAETVSPEIRRLSSLIAAPLVVEGAVVGVVHVGSLRPRRFTDAELHLLQVAADRVALAIRNAELYDRAQAEIRARARAEAELLERQDLHQLLAETAADAIVTMDEDSMIVSANPAAAEVFGYPLEELVGRPLTDLIPERHRRAHRAGVTRYLATGKRNLPWRGLELPGLHRSGREILLEVAFAERLRDGRHYFTGTMRDITERKATERLLSAQYAVTRVLAESAEVEEAVPQLLGSIGEALGWDVGAFWLWEPDEGVLRLGDCWLAPEVRGKGLEALVDTRTLAPGQGLPGRVKASGHPAWVADVTRDANFPRLAVAARVGLHGAFAFPVCVGGDCIGVMEFLTREVAEPDPALLEAMEALGSDVGQFIRRREAEERLREREETQSFLARTSIALAASALDYDSTLDRLAQLAVPTLADWCAVFIRREDGRIERVVLTHADPAREGIARKLAGTPVEERDAHPAVQVIRTGEPILSPELPEEEIEAVARDAEHLEILRSLGPRSGIAVPLTARGRILGALLLVTAESGRRFDRTDLEVAEEFARRGALSLDNARLFRDAQQANRAKAEFVAVMSHELRTPLNALVGYTDLLKMGIGGEMPSTGEEYVERIRVAARHLTGLIEEILTFSRLEAERDPVSLAPVSLAEVVEEITVIAEPLAREKGLRFTARQPPDPIQIDSDPGKVRQIVLNLVSNAVKFTQEGEVELEVRREEEAVVLEVRDTGVGIAPEHQEKIFDPFWQVEQGTTRQAGGTGLGLSVTRKLVELLGGEIRLRSTPGEGSSFTVRLPAGGPPERIEKRGSDHTRAES